MTVFCKSLNKMIETERIFETVKEELEEEDTFVEFFLKGPP